MRDSRKASDQAADVLVEALLFTADGRANPYPLYHRLRDANPVHRTTRGMWLLTRYDDCWAMMRDPRFGKAYARHIEQRYGSGWRQHPALAAQEHAMLHTGGAEHTRLRKLVTKSFTPRTIANLKPVIEQTVAALLEPIAEAGGGELMAGLAFPLPISIIGAMLGVPEPDRAQFHHLVRDLTAVFEMMPTAEQLAAADSAYLAIAGYFSALIRSKRRHPDEDLLSTLACAEASGDRLSDDELVTMAALLFGAGFEASTNLIGNGILGLLRHPQQMAHLRGDPSLFANLPDELLRYDGTAQLVGRVTEAAVDIGGVNIPAGEQVYALIGAGNRDPARYADPDQLDVRRTEINPLSFGGGVHFCLGAALARAEIGITFSLLLERFDSIELRAEPEFQDRLTLRGLNALHVNCRRSRGAQVERGLPKLAATGQPAVAAAGAGAAAVARGFRPGSGSDADLRWRTELRQRIENEPGRADSLPLLTGERLAAATRLLSRNSLFQTCSQAELEALAATSYPMSFEPGDCLCIEGSDAPEAYMIAAGQAVVTVGGAPVGTVGEDDIVGERGPLLGMARAATVTATTHMVTYAISRQRLRDLVETNPPVRDWMIAEMARRYPPASRQ